MSNFANDMELPENSIIIDSKLDRMLEPELGGHFTHAYCTAGECEVTFNGQVFTVREWLKKKLFTPAAK